MSPKLRTALLAGLLVCGMGGLGYASVPLYRLFCEVTGINGTTNRGLTAPGATGESVRVAFDANVNPRLAWRFRPEVRSADIAIGARDMAFFTATNTSNRPITGTATFNVTPYQAGKYFTKIQCFCFTEQTLQPGEEVRMPVLYYIDPKAKDDPLMADVEQVTLSYTFHQAKDAP